MAHPPIMSLPPRGKTCHGLTKLGGLALFTFDSVAVTSHSEIPTGGKVVQLMQSINRQLWCPNDGVWYGKMNGRLSGYPISQLVRMTGVHPFIV